MQRSKILALVVGLVITGGGGYLAVRPNAQPAPRRHVDAVQTMDAALHYIAAHQHPDGRFDYKVGLDGTPQGNRYNVLRHAGTVYALSEHHATFPRPETARLIVKAAKYLRTHHLKPLQRRPGMLAILSLPGEEVKGQHPEAKLGGSALGLIALLRARPIDPTVATPEELRRLASFMVSMQEPDGHFRSKWELGMGTYSPFESEYYPGEAILALTLMYGEDPDPIWRAAAMRAARYIVDSRRGSTRLPPDHWLMIGASHLLLHTRDDTEFSSLLRTHVASLGLQMLTEQQALLGKGARSGGFLTDGRCTPTATRMEGLAAWHSMLPTDDPMRPRIARSLRLGTAFLARCQVQEGGALGGIMTAVHVPDRERPVRQVVRIDYVQHALSALLGHHRVEQSAAVALRTP